jgi:hypothetical protein
MGKTFSTGLLTNGVFQDASNNIGIGAAPSGTYKLEVTGTAKVSSTLLVSGALTGGAVATFTAAANPLILKSTSATTGYTEYYYNTSTLAGIIGNGGGILTGANNSDFIVRSEADFVVATGGNNRRLTIASGGNVGIGTTSPANLLHLAGASATPSLRLSSSANIAFYWDIGRENASTGDFVFNNAVGGAATERMRITGGGDVCFGKTVYDNSTTGVSIADTKTTAIVSVVTDAGVSILCNRKTSTGDIVVFRYNGSGVGSISTNGSTTSYNITSDYRLKEDLKEINGLEKVCAIKVYDFKWKNSENRMDGVIAHELAEVMPYAVSGKKDAVDEDGNIIYQGVDYSKIVPVLVKAIQEMNTKLDEQNQTIQNLQEQINAK